MRRFKRFIALSMVLFLFAGAWTAIATGTPGTSTNPAVQLSYLTDIFTPKMIKEAETRTDTALENSSGGANAKYLATKENINKILAQKVVTTELINAISVKIGQGMASGNGETFTVSPAAGQRLLVTPGSVVALVQGTAKLSGLGAVNLGTGTELAAGAGVPARQQLLFTDAAGGIIEFTTASTVLMDGSYTLQAAYTPQYTDLAQALNSLGLLLGTGKGYELERDATRAEGLVMMVRLMGDEAAALSYGGKHPFTDVPDWVDRYVAYAYNMGWTLGVGGNRFAPGDAIDSRQFMTMLLRAMEYDNTTFNWEESLDVAVQKNILLSGERDMLRVQCKRDHLAYMSYYVLDGLCQPGYTLQQKLINKGVFTAEQVGVSRSSVTRNRK